MMESWSILSVLANFGPLLFIATSIVLYVKTRSAWMLVAAILEFVSLLFHGALFFGVQFLSNNIFMAAWQLNGLLVGVCFLGFALTLQRDD